MFETVRFQQLMIQINVKLLKGSLRSLAKENKRHGKKYPARYFFYSCLNPSLIVQRPSRLLTSRALEQSSSEALSTKMEHKMAMMQLIKRLPEGARAAVHFIQ